MTDENFSLKNEVSRVKQEKEESDSLNAENTRLMKAKAVEKFNEMLEEVIFISSKKKFDNVA